MAADNNSSAHDRNRAVCGAFLRNQRWAERGEWVSEDWRNEGFLSLKLKAKTKIVLLRDSIQLIKKVALRYSYACLTNPIALQYII